MFPHLIRSPNVRRIFTAILSNSKISIIDRSKFPTLNDADLEEIVIRGDAPGGPSIQRTNNCVLLTHKPTGISARCHTSKSLEENRKEVRQILLGKLDDFYNKENSISAQFNWIKKAKMNKNLSKRDKLKKLKAQWKINENL